MKDFNLNDSKSIDKAAPKVGRPASNRAKANKQVLIYVTEQEKELIRSVADEQGKSLSDFVKSIVMKYFANTNRVITIFVKMLWHSHNIWMDFSKLIS